MAITLAMAASFVSDHYGGPTLLYCLLMGMAFFHLSRDTRFAKGIAFASSMVLRVGVALLGARITAGQVASLGPAPVLIVVVGVAATIFVGWALARALRLHPHLGLLTGGAVAICGASAALALAAALPRRPGAERDTIFTVLAVTTLSTCAMIAYPVLVAALGLPAPAAGVFLGGTIHDVAQVVGAGYLISPEVGDVATFTKLFRVATLVVAVPLVAQIAARGAPGDEGARRGLNLRLPWFLVAFVLLVAVNSTGFIPADLDTVLNHASRWCLIVAIAGIGMKSSFEEMAQLGWRPVALAVGETLFLAALVLGLVKVLAIGA
jgi:uncharacterized integral membrane protein (TIGR00698 family)